VVGRSYSYFFLLTGLGILTIVVEESANVYAAVAVERSKRKDSKKGVPTAPTDR
jgi:hypothetical protein